MRKWWEEWFWFLLGLEVGHRLENNFRETDSNVVRWISLAFSATACPRLMSIRGYIIATPWRRRRNTWSTFWNIVTTTAATVLCRHCRQPFLLAFFSHLLQNLVSLFLQFQLLHNRIHFLRQRRWWFQIEIHTSQIMILQCSSVNEHHIRYLTRFFLLLQRFHHYYCSISQVFNQEALLSSKKQLSLSLSLWF